MVSAPPVAVRCGGGLVWRSVQALLPTLAVGASAVWCLQRLELDIAPAAGAALAAGLWGWWCARPHPVDLVWDGQRWTAQGLNVVPQLMIDLGPWLLLRLQPAEPRASKRWVACSAAEARGAWHGLRAALYSRPSVATQRVRPPDRAAD